MGPRTAESPSLQKLQNRFACRIAALASRCPFCIFSASFLLLLSCRTPLPGPESVTLLTPGADTTLHSGNVVFDWDSTSGAVSYELQVDDKTTFITPVFDTLGVVARSAVCFLADGDYHWRVRGRSSDSAWGDWSEARHLMVATYRIIGQIQTRGYPEAIDVRGDYAYVADGEAGLSIYDVSDLGNLRLAGSIMDTQNLAYGVSVAGHYAYLAYGRKQIQVVDIARFDSLQLLGSISYTSTSYGYDLKALDTTTVIVANHKKFTVVDVTDPNFPNTLGRETPALARGVAVRGATAFLACEQIGLAIMTFSRETKPEAVGIVRTAENARDVAVQGNYAYVADGRCGLTIIDISDSTHPRIVDSLPLPGKGYAGKVAVHDSVVYVGDETAGLAVADISNPLRAKLVAMLKTPYAKAVFVTQDGRVFATDRDWGLLSIERAPN